MTVGVDHPDDGAGPVVRSRRFLAFAALVARIYAGYKLIQVGGKLGARTGARYHRQHRRSAEAVYRFATRLEGLPIKVAQFLGSRADILPSEYVDVLSKLHDRVPPRPIERMRPVLEHELGADWRTKLPALDTTPIASASLAQVHRGRLADGRDVAVKIQYPEIARLVGIDLRNFSFFVRLLARIEPDFDFRVLIDEVEKYIPLELDFEHEAANAARMRASFAGRTDVLVPEVVAELSTRRVLVMEYAPGVRITDIPAVRALGLDPKTLAQRLITLFCDQILVHGFFHADPHPGNILVQPDGRLVLLDFGLAKDLPPSFRDGIARLTFAIMSGDRAQVAAAFRAIGFRTREDSDDSLYMLGEAFLGYALKTGRSYADPEMVAHFSDDMPRVMRANPLVEVPGDILLIGRVLGLLSGIGRSLGSEVDITATLLPYLAGAAMKGAAPAVPAQR